MAKKMYENIVELYRKTRSISKTAKELKTNEIKVRRVLITEGLWTSKETKRILEQYNQGKTTAEIAQELNISIKTVQAYIPYKRGQYGGNNGTNNSQRSKRYRERMEEIYKNQVMMDLPNERAVKTASLPNKKFVIRKRTFDSVKRLPSVMLLKLDLILPGKYKTEEFKAKMQINKGITREMLVPGEMKLHALHYAIQRLFGWNNCHSRRFSLSETDFKSILGDNPLENYKAFCGALFRVPGEYLNDRYWDDDYIKGLSIKSWYKSKYSSATRSLGVCDTLLRNRQNMDKIEECENLLLEDISIRNLLRNPKENKPDFKWWRQQEAHLLQEAIDSINEEAQNVTLSVMKDLVNTRCCYHEIRRSIANRRGEDIKKAYMMEPMEAYKEYQQKISILEEALMAHLAESNPYIIPFADEIIYNYGSKAGWKVKITCLDVYTASENYDESYINSLEAQNAVTEMPKRIPYDQLLYTNKQNQEADLILRGKLQYVYLKKKPLCIATDGLCVADFPGGAEEFYVYMQKGGQTSRKINPQNML